MKKLMALIVALILLALGAAACAEDDYEQGIIADMNAAPEIKARAEAAIQSIDKILYGTVFESVTINPNYGTDASGDFIALVDMSYTGHVPAGDFDLLTRISNNITGTLVRECPEVVEACVFWDLPGYGDYMRGKLAYTIEGGAYQYADVMLPREIIR